MIVTRAPLTIWGGHVRLVKGVASAQELLHVAFIYDETMGFVTWCKALTYGAGLPTHPMSEGKPSPLSKVALKLPLRVSVATQWFG